MSQLQEMQITSPGFVTSQHQASQHEAGANYTTGNTPFMVQSFRLNGAANSNNMSRQFFQSNPLSPITVNSNGMATLNDYPNSNWPTSLANALAGTNANTIHHSMLSTTVSANSLNNGNGYSEIVMEDLSNLQVNLNSTKCYICLF